jgi:DnaK suppressor protein
MQQHLVSSSMPKGYDPLKDTDYLSPDMCNYFKHKLEELREQILKKEDSISLNLVHTTTREADLLDQGATEDLHYGELSIQEHEERLRQEIENALQRLKDGTYGYCEITGNPIGVKRLILIPTARYSIKAQEKIEKDYKR